MLKQEHAQLQNKLDSLIDLIADGVLTREEFARKKSQLKDRQYEISGLLASYDRVDDKFSKKLVSLINITTNALETFKGSNLKEKREFLNFVFANLSLKGCKLQYDWVFPFSELAKLTNCTTWRRERDSNPR